MIKCKFSFGFGDNEFHLDDKTHLDIDADVDSKPEKDEEGNWKLILMNFKLDDNGPIWEIFSKFYSSDKSTRAYGSAILLVDDDAYLLYNVWPKSLKFDNESNFEIVWRFNGVTIFRK